MHSPFPPSRFRLRRYFKQSKLTSFQRQLNLYGFQRISTGRDRGGYFHPLFLRGRADICHSMLRTRVKGGAAMAAVVPVTGDGRPAAAAAATTLYDLPPCGEGTSSSSVTTVRARSSTSVEEKSLTDEEFEVNDNSLSRMMMYHYVNDPVKIVSSVLSNPLVQQQQHPKLFRPELSPSFAHSTVLDDASACTVSPSSTIINNESSSTDCAPPLPVDSQRAPPYLPWMNRLPKESFRLLRSASSAATTIGDGAPHPLDTYEEEATVATESSGSSSDDLMGIFEGQAFLFMDDENLRVYESAVIGV